VILLEAIKRKKIRCWTSYYTILELMDREQENKWIWKRVQNGETLDDFLRHRYPRKLSEAELHAVYSEVEDKFFKPFVDTDIISVMIPDDKSWDAILKLLQKSNFSIGDAFQLDAAIGSNCNIFITRDSELVKMVNDAKLIPAAQPQDLEKKLAALGMRHIL
jgi:predicted nucleic acid-binding protein